MPSWSDHYRYDKYLFVHAADTVFAARVNQSSFSYPIYQATFDGVTTGAFGDIQTGQTILFGSTAGASDLGRQRVRKAATSDTLYFGWSSNGTRDGELNLSDDAYITVIDDYRAWSKIPRITKNGTLYKDYDIAYTTGTPSPPKANAGVWVAQLVDSSDEITVSFDGSDSFATANGASISSYAWDFGDGTPGSAATATVSDVVFPVGDRWVHLTVTDSNGKTHTHHILVVALKVGTNAITKFEVSQQTLARNGQNISLSIFENLPETTYYDGCAVIYFEDEYYNNVRGSLAGPTGRRGVKFAGWHDTDTTSLVASEATYATGLELSCVDIGGRMRQLPAFPQVVLRDAAPGSWTELIAANTDRYIHYLLHWHSTVLDVAQFTWSGTGDTYAVPRFESAGQNLWEQINFRSQSIARELTVTMRGILALTPDPQLQDSGDRTSTIITDITDSEWTSINYTHTRPPRVYWLWGSAIVANTQEADASNMRINGVYCVAPGKAPGQGESEQEQGSQLVADQTELNAREGHRYAVRLNPEQTFFEIELTHPGDVGIDPALMQWVRLTVSSAQAGKRGDTLSLVRFLPFELDIVHNNNTQTKRLLLRAEREAVGTPAQTRIPPTSSTTGSGGVWPGTSDVILPDIPSIDSFPVIYTSNITSDTADTVYAADERYVYGCPDFTSAGTPAWSKKFDAVVDVGASYTIIEYQHDNLDPKNTAIVVVANGSTSLRVYRTTNLSAGTPTWTLMQNIVSGADRALLQNSIYDGLWFLLIQDSGITVFYKTVNNFTSFDTTIVSPTGGSPFSWHTFFISNHAASKTSGKIVMSYGAGANQSHVTVSTNYGSSFTPDLTWTFSDFHPPAMVHMPYQGNEAELTWYVMGGEDSGNDAWTVKTTDGGDNYTDISPVYDDLLGDGPLSYGGGEQNQRSKKYIADYTQNSQLLAMIAWPSTQNYGTNHQQQIFVSDDGGENWTRQSGTSQTINEIVVWPYDENQLFFSGTSKLYYSSDRGVTLSEKQWVGYSNGVRCVPVWVA